MNSYICQEFYFKKVSLTKFKKNPIWISNKLTLVYIGLDQILTNKMINYRFRANFWKNYQYRKICLFLIANYYIYIYFFFSGKISLKIISNPKSLLKLCHDFLKSKILRKWTAIFAKNFVFKNLVWLNITEIEKIHKFNDKLYLY